MGMVGRVGRNITRKFLVQACCSNCVSGLRQSRPFHGATPPPRGIPPPSCMQFEFRSSTPHAIRISLRPDTDLTALSTSVSEYPALTSQCRVRAPHVRIRHSENTMCRTLTHAHMHTCTHAYMHTLSACAHRAHAHNDDTMYHTLSACTY
eukprot:94502-Chlamydomonas_euryale.AAC.3